jgi:hypothetical protein
VVIGVEIIVLIAVQHVLNHNLGIAILKVNVEVLVLNGVEIIVLIAVQHVLNQNLGIVKNLILVSMLMVSGVILIVQLVLVLFVKVQNCGNVIQKKSVL